MLTRTGLGVLIGTAICTFFGLLWRYEELLTLAAAGAIAVGFALYTSRLPTWHHRLRVGASWFFEGTTPQPLLPLGFER